MARRPILPPAYFLGSLIVMMIIHFGAPGPIWLEWPGKGVGLVALVYGVWLTGRAANLFDRHGTTIKPFESSTVLVTDGPFARSRNPMYLGMVIIHIAIALLLGTLAPWIVIPVFAAIMTNQFVAPEEEALEQQFGDAYRDYTARVRRWI